jgi:BlaI family penicillinase repressor
MKRAHALSRRERQIMDILYKTGKGTAAEVRDAMPDAPSYSAVRAMLRILEEKGHLRHEQDGPRYVFLPAEPRDQAMRSALRHLVETFFEGSVEQTVTALLDTGSKNLKPSELDKLSRMIEEARKKGV